MFSHNRNNTREANYIGGPERTTKFSWNKCDCVEIPVVGLAKAQKGEIPAARYIVYAERRVAAPLNLMISNQYHYCALRRAGGETVD